jgi:type VI secretion system protein VasG
MSVDLRSLIGKLNETTRSTLEAAAGLCLSRTHYDVEIEHFLLKLLDSTNADFAAILKYFEIDRARLSGELNRSLDKLKSGNARTPAFSPTLVRMFTEAWSIGSINYGAREVRSGYAILALVTEQELNRLVRDVSREFE